MMKNLEVLEEITITVTSWQKDSVRESVSTDASFMSQRTAKKR